MRLAVFPGFARGGGGSFQWTANLLSGVGDYAAARPGIGVHVYHLPALDDIEELKVRFSGFRFHRIGRLRAAAAAATGRLAFAMPWLIPFLRWLSPLDRAFRQDSIDWILFPVTGIQSSLCRTPHSFFLADIAHVFHPQFPEVSAGGELRRRRILFERGLAAAGHVVVESAELRRQIERHYGADVRKVDVLYQALPVLHDGLAEVTDSDRAREVRALPARYLFYPAQLWAHKNHGALLQALASLREEFTDLHLVLTGGRQPGDERIFERMDALRLRDVVHYLGYVPDRLMPELYRGAVALVMPTYFGPTNIPTLEAFHFGCPAVISDLPGVREQVGDAALLFDPDSPDEIVSHVRRLLHDPELRGRLIDAGRLRSERFGYPAYRAALFTILDRRLPKLHQDGRTGTAVDGSFIGSGCSTS